MCLEGFHGSVQLLLRGISCIVQEEGHLTRGFMILYCLYCFIVYCLLFYCFVVLGVPNSIS